MTGPIHRKRMEDRLEAKRQSREAQPPWYMYGPEIHRPEPTVEVRAITYREALAYYMELKAVHARAMQQAIARLSVHRVPLTPELLDYLEKMEIRKARDQMHALDDHRATRKEQEKHRKENSWVYFIENGDRIKIGVSTDVVARATSLSLRWTDVVAVIKGTAKLEKALHRRFAEERIGSTEWFHDCPRIRDYIKRYAEPFSAQHPAYRKPVQPDGVHPEVAYSRLAKAMGLDVSGGSVGHCD